jgi:hypothetical protein
MNRARLTLGGLLLGLGAGTIFACADSNAEPPAPVDAGPQPLPQVDAAPVDAGSNEDAGGCADAAGCVTTTDCTIVDFCAQRYPVVRTTALNAIWGTAPDDVWIVGNRGTILHGNGSSFEAVPTDSNEVFFSVWGSGKNDVWFLDSRSPLHSSGFAGGGTTLERVPGSSWNEGEATSGRLWTGHSVGADAVWLGGEPTKRFTDWSLVASFYRREADADGGAFWSPTPACTSSAPCEPKVRAFWGDGTVLWAVGMNGQAFVLDDPATGHWDYRNPRTGSNLEGIWGSSADDIWAVGEDGVIRHTTANGPWTEIPSPTTADLHAIWGGSASDVWAVGDNGTVLHYDGKDWSIATIGLSSGDTPVRLNSIWGSSADDVWIAGNGLLLHRTSSSRKQP